MSKKEWVEISKDSRKIYKSTKKEGSKYYAEISYDKKGQMIDSETYTKEFNKELYGDKEGCLAKILKSPFRLIWWLLKKSLNIITFGIIAQVLSDEDTKK